MHIARACACTLACVACGEPDPGLAADFELETDRVIVRGFGREADEVCGGTLAHIDASADWLAGHFGAPAGLLGVYEWYAQDVWQALPAGDRCLDGGACVRHDDGDPARLLSRNIPHDHELVHLVRESTIPVCVFVLDEGLAELLRGASPTTSGSLEGASLDHALAVSFDGASPTGSDYHRARHFVSFLAWRNSLDDVIELCSRLPRGSSRGSFEAELAALLGTSFEALLAEYAEAPACDEVSDRLKELECMAAPDLEVAAGGEDAIDFAAACSSADALGPSAEGGHVIRRRARVLGGTNHGVWVETADPTGIVVRVEPCTPCFEGGVGYGWGPLTADWIDLPVMLPVGDYVVTLEFPAGFEGDVHLRLLSGP